MREHDSILTDFARNGARGNPISFLAFTRALIVRLYYLTVHPGHALDVAVRINLECSGLLYSQFHIDAMDRQGDLDAMIEYLLIIAD